MAERFIVTGSGRCGTKFMARLLAACGVRAGHERVFTATGVREWGDRDADSSWMAVPHLADAGVPVVLLVRHPLAVVRSWVEIGFFSPLDINNPTHQALEWYAPEVYDYESEADRALAMWLRLNSGALRYAEAMLRLEQLDASVLARLLRWSGRADTGAAAAVARVERCNRHDTMRAKVRVRHEPVWDAHDKGLAAEGRALARLLGYDPEVVPGV